ncbi:unnamed protein product, partial [Polarella glacialis]
MLCMFLPSAHTRGHLENRLDRLDIHLMFENTCRQGLCGRLQTRCYTADNEPSLFSKLHLPSRPSETAPVGRSGACQGSTADQFESAADPLFDLEYADDTVLMSRSSHNITKLLQCLQKEAEPYGMALNRAKTKLLVVSGPPAGVVTFTDNTPVHVVGDN